MPKLDDYTMSAIADYYVQRLIEKGLATTKSEAKKLFLNALSYNLVVEAIENQVAFIKEADEEE